MPTYSNWKQLDVVVIQLFCDCHVDEYYGYLLVDANIHKSTAFLYYCVCYVRL